MTTPNIITFHPHYLEAAAYLYQHVYGVRHYEDRTPLDTSYDVIAQHWMRESFLGVLAVDEQQAVVGMAYGYNTPSESQNKRMNELIIKKMGEEWTQATFIVEVFVVHPDYGQGELSARLNHSLLNRLREEGYQRARTRLEIARMDNLPATLRESGWEELQRLPHVVWLGKRLGD